MTKQENKRGKGMAVSFNTSAIYVRFCARLYVHSAGQICVERSCRNGSYRELYLEYYIFPGILAFHLNRTRMHTNLQSANKKKKKKNSSLENGGMRKYFA